MDPTPNEAEMREAGQWASLQGAVDLEEKCMMRDAYAAALAKCRGQVEAERTRCANAAWDTINRLYPDGSLHDLQEEINTEIRGGVG